MRRWQNRMAESSATLPTACVVATLLWWLPQGAYSTAYLLSWLTCALTTYLLLEMTAQNALLRVRSRMISSLFLFIMAVCGFLHPLQTSVLSMLCLTFSFYYLLRTCDAQRPEVNTMHAYLAISMGSLLWPPLLLLVPVQLWSQGVYLRSLTRRNFGAALIGVLLPYIFWATGAFALGRITQLIDQAAAIIAPFTEPWYWQWAVDLARSAEDSSTFFTTLSDHFIAQSLAHPTEVIALTFVLLLGLTGFIHYVTKNYDDKIRVRMCHYALMAMQVAIILWLALQPQLFYLLFPLLVVTTVPAAGHFIALSHTWLSNAWVIILLLLLIATGVSCLALPSLLNWPQPSLTPLNFVDFSFLTFNY